MERDCNTCAHHVQGVSLDDAPALCWSCSAATANGTGNLPAWRPINMEHAKPDALSTQVDGDHYKSLKIQPIEFSVTNKLNPIQHSIVKYAVRKKAGIEGRRKDFNKIIHFAQIGLQMLDRGEDV